ncbi:MAG TPA: sensor histidine kinase [Acidimicrobiales bacterium]|nr:sensor histidine kinase [Acidimicrobiales bacterium]
MARRRSPLWVLVAVWAATAAFLGLRYPPVTTALAGAAVATHGVAAYRSSAAGHGQAGLTAALVVALAGIAMAVGYSAAEGVALLLLFVTAWVMGDRARTRREYLEALEERAQLLEREREAQVQAAAGAERTRIARELHDVIAHGVSVIVLHARGAKEVLDEAPDVARRSLDLIERTGRDAMQELRTVVGALRTDDGSGAAQPQPGLDNLDELVRRTEAAGVSVVVTIEGTSSPLPTAVDLAAYRIVQEALSNTLKHSIATTAEVAIGYEDDRLLVRVTDEGPPRDHAAATPGYGLVGMGERVSMVGGDLRAQPRRGGGYEVLAVLPLGGKRR